MPLNRDFSRQDTKELHARMDDEKPGLPSHGVQVGDSVEGQLDQVKAHLLRDGAPHGIDEDTVRRAVDDAGGPYT